MINEKKEERVTVTITLSPLVYAQIVRAQKECFSGLVPIATLTAALVEWGIVYQAGVSETFAKAVYIKPQ